MQVKIKNESELQIPAYATEGSAGIDLRANVDRYIPTVIRSRERYAVPTGIYMEIPKGYEGQIRPRSGLAFKHGITVLNAPGTIDSDFRGEIKVILINHGWEDFEISYGDRIAQMVFAKVEQAQMVQISELSETQRGEGGFGHTGVI